MNKLTHDYNAQYTAQQHGNNDFDEYYTELFEHEAAQHIAHLQRNDVGGVILYCDSNGNELAFFDYDNLVGSVQAIGGTHSEVCCA